MGVNLFLGIYVIAHSENKCSQPGCTSDKVYHWGDRRPPSEGVDPKPERFAVACIRHAAQAIHRELGLSGSLSEKERCAPRHFSYKDYQFSIGVHDAVNCIVFRIYGRNSVVFERPICSSGAFYDIPEEGKDAWDWAEASCLESIDRLEEKRLQIQKEIREELEEERKVEAAMAEGEKEEIQ